MTDPTDSDAEPARGAALHWQLIALVYDLFPLAGIVFFGSAITYALNGAEFIFYPTAIGSEPDAPEIDTAESWQTVMRGQAIANGVFIAAANRVGQEGVTFYGSSFICDPMGRVLAQASRDQTEVIVAELDTAVFDQWRYLFPLLRQRRPEVYGKLTQP